MPGRLTSRLQPRPSGPISESAGDIYIPSSPRYSRAPPLDQRAAPSELTPPRPPCAPTPLHPMRPVRAARY
eukprot:2788813-Rhodomonas_salina.1